MAPASARPPAPAAPVPALELQRAVGNRAATALLQPKPTVRQQAREELDAKLERAAAEAREFLAAPIEARMALDRKQGKLTRAERARLAELTKATSGYESLLDDLALIRDPRTPASKLGELLARHGSKSSTALAAEVGHRSLTVSSFTDGYASSRAESVTTETDLAELKYSHVADDQRSVSKDGRQVSWGTKTTSSFSAKDMAFTKEIVRSRTAADGSSSSSTTSATFGLGGASVTSGSENVRDGRKTGTEASAGVAFGGGAITTKGGVKTTDLEVDSEGEAVGGTEVSTDVEQSLKIGGNTLGGGLKIGQARDKIHGKGLKTTFTCGAEAGGDVKVVKVAGKKDRFKVVLTLKLGVSAGYGGKASHKGSGTEAGASAGGKLSRTLIFSHVMSEAESLQYLERLGLAAGGDVDDGKFPEFAVMATAAEHGADLAKVVAFGGAASFGSSTGALLLAEGASMEVIDEAGFEGKGSAGAKGAGAGVGVSGGYAASGKRRMVITKGAKNQLEVTLAISTEDSVSAGVTGSLNAASMGASGERGSSSARVVKVTLDAGAPGAAAALAALTGVRTRAQLDEVLAKTPLTLEADTRSSGRSSKSDVSGGAVGVKLKIGSGTSGGYSVATEGGKVTETYEGANELNASMSIADRTVASSSVKDAFKGDLVTEDGKSYGEADVSTERTNLDQGKSVDAFMKGISNDPLGMLTGAVEYSKQTTDIHGVKLTNEDLRTIAGLAASKSDWMHAVPRAALIDDWIGVRLWIMQEGQTTEAVIQGLAAFLEREGSGRRETVQRLLQPIEGGSRGGSRYEQAAGMKGDLAGEYSKLIGRGGDSASAAEFEALIKSVFDNEANFRDPTAAAEMVRRLADRLAEKHGTPQARYDALVATCKASFLAERRMFDLIEAETDQVGFFGNKIRADLKVVYPLFGALERMYEEWDKSLAELRALIDAHGFRKTPADVFKPNRTLHRHMRAKVPRIQG